ncbi:hypothetical protein [Weissella paramesenteroides]|uniref:hypothetical protein n=1 Tax=Weissella paramesenteroides TaxID=1249 RepID=UPI00388D4CBE
MIFVEFAFELFSNVKLSSDAFWNLIGVLLSAVTSAIVAFLVVQWQKKIDVKRVIAEKVPQLKMGVHQNEFIEFNFGNFLNTEISILKNKMEYSSLKIPIINVGESTVTNIAVLAEIQNINQIQADFKKSWLDNYDGGQMYLSQHSDGKLSFEYSRVNEVKKRTITVKDNNAYMVGALRPGEQADIYLGAYFDLFVQYFFYQSQDRIYCVGSAPGGPDTKSATFSHNLPVLRLKVTFDDYQGNENVVELLGRVIVTKSSYKTGGPKRRKMEFIVRPLRGAESVE